MMNNLSPFGRPLGSRLTSNTASQNTRPQDNNLDAQRKKTQDFLAPQQQNTAGRTFRNIKVNNIEDFLTPLRQPEIITSFYKPDMDDVELLQLMNVDLKQIVKPNLMAAPSNMSIISDKAIFTWSVDNKILSGLKSNDSHMIKCAFIDGEVATIRFDSNSPTRPISVELTTKAIDNHSSHKQILDKVLPGEKKDIELQIEKVLNKVYRKCAAVITALEKKFQEFGIRQEGSEESEEIMLHRYVDILVEKFNDAAGFAHIRFIEHKLNLERTSHEEKFILENYLNSIVKTENTSDSNRLDEFSKFVVRAINLISQYEDAIRT